MKNNYPDYTKLIEYNRNNLTEQIHNGIILHINKDRIINKIGDDNNYRFYHRSCMKPFQASLLLDLNLDKKYNIDESELAVCAASHTGDLIHREKILSLLAKAGFKEDDLLCLPHEPLSKEENKRLIKLNLPFDKLHNNCSGKHSAMLIICRHFNYDISNYTDFEHPLFSLILNQVMSLCELSREDISISKDGCGLPVIASDLFSLGRGFLNLFSDTKYEKLKNAFLRYPYLIGGSGRLDSEIINAGSDIIAKVGAGGLCVVVNLKDKEALVVKIADSNMEARAFAVIYSLLQLNWIKSENINSSNLKKLVCNKITTQTGEVIGNILPCFDINTKSK